MRGMLEARKNHDPDAMEFHGKLFMEILNELKHIQDGLGPFRRACRYLALESSERTRRHLKGAFEARKNDDINGLMFHLDKLKELQECAQEDWEREPIQKKRDWPWIFFCCLG